MAESYQYVIVGAQLAGTSAVEGIRELDENGSILLVGRESHPPYDRPPLSKGLWFGKKTVEEIFLHEGSFYQDQHVELKTGTEVVALDAADKTITDGNGNTYQYGKLLLATGGQPRRLPIPGGDLPGVCHYRTLDDYARVHEAAGSAESALVVGGGFIGSEMAAALHESKVEVVMVYGGPYLGDRVFPEPLGRALEEDYRRRGIVVYPGDVPVAFESAGDRVRARTRDGVEVTVDLVVVGIGMVPETRLAETAGLAVSDGIVADELLRTSEHDVFAAGDNAYFPYLAIDRDTRVEHWDNAISQGRHAGRNMAGGEQPFTHMPYFFSDLFDFGYEAVGEVDSRLEVLADWKEENKTGVLYYLRDETLRGVMLCNLWDKVDAARELIRAKRRMTLDDVRGAIR